MRLNVNFTEDGQRFESKITENAETFTAALEEQDQTFALSMNETEQTFDASFDSTEQGFNPGFMTGDIYNGPYEVTPKTTGQSLPTKRKTMADDVNIFAIPYFEVGNISGGCTVYIGGNHEIQIE